MICIFVFDVCVFFLTCTPHTSQLAKQWYLATLHPSAHAARDEGDADVRTNAMVALGRCFYKGGTWDANISVFFFSFCLRGVLYAHISAMFYFVFFDIFDSKIGWVFVVSLDISIFCLTSLLGCLGDAASREFYFIFLFSFYFLFLF